MFIDTGTITREELAALQAADDAPERLPHTLEQAVAEHTELRPRASFAELRADGDGLELLVLTVDDIVALSERPLSLAWDEDDTDQPAADEDGERYPG